MTEEVRALGPLRWQQSVVQRQRPPGGEPPRPPLVAEEV